MNATKIFSVLTLLISSSVVYAAADGTITINGKVTDQTCTVGGTGGNYTVTLPTVPKASLGTSAATTGDTKFTVNLSNCPAGNVGIYYDNSNSNINAAGRLKNSASSGANNVDIQLLNSAKTPIDLTKDRLGQNIVNATIAQANGSANIDFYARYYATAPVTTAGDVTTTATYYVVYP